MVNETGKIAIFFLIHVTSNKPYSHFTYTAKEKKNNVNSNGIILLYCALGKLRHCS